jgi:carotenoid cleavage dioxygenase
MGRKPSDTATMPYSWDWSYPARVGVMPRDGGARDVRWFDVDPCYVFHTLNAYDDGDTVVVDLVRHPTMFDIDRNGPDDGPSTLERWTIDPHGEKVIETRIDDHSQEFPRVDERLLGHRHLYGYSVAAVTGTGAQASDAILRHDFRRGTTLRRSLGANKRGGEFVFVPNAADAAEDDGVLMGFAYDRSTDRSDLLILDSATLETVAAVHLPARVPHGFHGNWLPV